jgi:histidyl-tRNA synthetase
MAPDLTVRGTRDFYPELYAQLLHIIDAWRKTALSYGFEEFEGPILETLDLYKIKSGEEIVNQLYAFTDKGGRELALRPELTPSLARMVARVHGEAMKPMKWFSIPRCMRYEKPQKGRLREFFQFNADIIGEDGVLADCEIIAVAIDSLVALGLGAGDFVVKINNRNFVSGYFQQAGIGGEKTSALYKIIDNARKAEKAETESAIGGLRLDPAQTDAVRAYLDLRGSEDLSRLPYGGPGKDSLLELFGLFVSAGLAAFCEFDPSIVRGLDYYTGTVFEIFDRSESMRAICGGGRYNNLVREFGGADIPACGFGMGDVVLGEILQAKGLVPPYGKRLDYYLVRMGDGELGLMLRIARSLRKKGYSVEYGYRLGPVKKQMSRASKLGTKTTLILGPDEVAGGEVVEKNMATGEEKRVALSTFLG